MKKSFLPIILTSALLAVCAVGCGKETPSEKNDTLEIPDVTAWVGYPATEFFPKFFNPSKAETISYSYDESKIVLSPEKCTVQALEEGTVEVTATSEHFSATFTVTCKESDRDVAEIWRESLPYHTDWTGYVTNLKNQWARNGTENTTVFAGDSFFDVRAFWTDFYSVYAGKDALCFGIGSTHSYSWEYLADELLKDMNPKNLVIHLGTNNVYDIADSATEATEGLQRMFTVLHDRLPNTNIYYFTITHRSYDEMKQFAVNQVNAAMIAWCEPRSWITCLDTSPQITYDMLRDSIHPTLPSYSVFVNALEEVGIEIADLVS